MLGLTSDGRGHQADPLRKHLHSGYGSPHSKLEPSFLHSHQVPGRQQLNAAIATYMLLCCTIVNLNVFHMQLAFCQAAQLFFKRQVQWSSFVSTRLYIPV